MRGVSDKNFLIKFCEDFCKIVEKHSPYIIVSGFVAILSGRTRATEDIDMIIPKLTKEKFTALHKDLKKSGFSCIQGNNPKILFEDYLSEKTSIRYIKGKQLLPEMELKFAKDELDEDQIKNRQKIPLTGTHIWFSSIETNIAFKEEYLKSDKDLEDARHLRIVYKEEIDDKEINRIKNQIKRFRL